MKAKGLMNEFWGEVFGTFVLVLLGDGVVANVGLAPRLASTAYNWNTIAIGWCFAVVIAVYISGGVSGAHLNPAVTFAMAFKRGFAWKKVLPYILAQMLGAFLGAAAVYLVYRDGLISAGMPNVWSTGPGSVFGASFWGGAGSESSGVYTMVTACVAEFFGTMVLLWGILASGDMKNMGLKDNLGALLVGFTVLAVGLSLGGPSGYSINPARDLGPRIFGALVGTKGLFDGLYWLLPPVLIPCIAGPIGVVLYDLFISKNLPNKG
ncbi:MAG: glycerol uptake facilitator protein [Chloroflexota bacterium]|nr:glycerol uptake facilitator protein [Chloroflexota bacterium]